MPSTPSRDASRSATRNTAPVTRTDTLIDPRATYEYQPDPVIGSYKEVPFRFNEMYFNFTKGPLFVRIGRQAISWGESDTVALLDANNPFNQTLAIPGVFQDVDEARIPLFTLRATYSLFDTLGPDLERLRRRLLGSRQHRHHRQPDADPDGEPVLAAPARPAGADQRA